MSTAADARTRCVRDQSTVGVGGHYGITSFPLVADVFTVPAMTVYPLQYGPLDSAVLAAEMVPLGVFELARLSGCQRAKVVREGAS